MCNKKRCAGQYTVDLINNNISRDVQEECANNLVPFLPDTGFQLLKCLWSSLIYFSFNDVPNVLYR